MIWAHEGRISLVNWPLPICGLLFCCSPGLFAQQEWNAAGVTGTVYSINQVYIGESSGAVYVAGAIDTDLSTTGIQNALFKYEDGVWALIPMNCYATSVIEFHDTLFVVGDWGPDPTNPPAYTNVAYYNGVSWMPYGAFSSSSAHRLRAINDTLYLVGSFTVADGQQCNGIAKRQGGQWISLPLLPSTDNIVWDIIDLNGDLIVCGYLYVGSTRAIARLHDGMWSAMGNGLLGGLSSIHEMCVYHDALYLGGQISMDEGNPGRDIMRWTGSAFEGVGGGLQRNFGDNSGFSGVGSMVVHNDVLFVGGGFRYAGGVPAFGVAGWNGSQWCAVPGNLSNGMGYYGVIGGMAFYQDTLFAACGPLADGDSVNFFARFIGGSYTDTCSVPLMIQEQSGTEGLVIRPNPSYELINVALPIGSPPCRMELLDGLGRVINARIGTTVRYSIAGLAKGVYIVRAEGYGAQRVLLE
jgi:hypothetical protein